MSVKVYVHELKGMGFWVEVEETLLMVLTSRHFIASDGTLEEMPIIYPHRVVRHGLFKDQSAAILAANQYAGIKAREAGRRGIPIVFNLDGGAS